MSDGVQERLAQIRERVAAYALRGRISAEASELIDAYRERAPQDVLFLLSIIDGFTWDDVDAIDDVGQPGCDEGENGARYESLRDRIIALLTPEEAE